MNSLLIGGIILVGGGTSSFLTGGGFESISKLDTGMHEIHRKEPMGFASCTCSTLGDILCKVTTKNHSVVVETCSVRHIRKDGKCIQPVDIDFELICVDYHDKGQ
jgi:hypothetical protein